MGYHTKEITKGEIGSISKITEEYEELIDASEQMDKVLMICELTDLIGAIEIFAEKNFNLSLRNLIEFSRKTQEAFKEGKRK